MLARPQRPARNVRSRSLAACGRGRFYMPTFTFAFSVKICTFLVTINKSANPMTTFGYHTVNLKKHLCFKRALVTQR